MDYFSGSPPLKKAGNTYILQKYANVQRLALERLRRRCGAPAPVEGRDALQAKGFHPCGGVGHGKKSSDWRRLSKEDCVGTAPGGGRVRDRDRLRRCHPGAAADDVGERRPDDIGEITERWPDAARRVGEGRTEEGRP